MEEEKTWFQRNQNKIMVVGLIVIVGLLIIPDVYLRKAIPWVK